MERLPNPDKHIEGPLPTLPSLVSQPCANFAYAPRKTCTTVGVPFCFSVPFVSPSLARVARIMSPAGGLVALEVVAELAALDGLRDHAKSIQALEQARGGALGNA